MLNVAIFCHDHKGSGANLSLVDWLKNVNNQKIHIIVVLPRYDKNFYNLLKQNGIEDIVIGHYMVVIKKLYKLNFVQKLKDFIKIIYAFLFNKLMYNILSKKLKRKNVDIIHTNSFCTLSGVHIADKLNIPHIFHVREFMEEDHQIAHYNEKKVKYYCAKSHAIFISDVIANKYNYKYQFITTKLLYDQISYDKNYKKQREFLEDDICKMIIVGTVSKNKGHIDIINGVKLLNANSIPVELYICGAGPYENYLKKYISDNKIENIYFLGFRSDVINLRKQMDIALMCSENEALGRVTVEAQYYENLIIGANCGCTPYIIDDMKTGLLYNKKIKNDLYKKIKYAIDNKEESVAMIKEAKKKSIQNFNVNIEDKIIDYYNEILN